MAALSLDLRQRVLADCQAGLTYAAIARKYTVPAEWARTSYKRFRATGEVAARRHATRRQPSHARHEAELRAAVAEKPDRALEELRQHMGGAVSVGPLWGALRALEISFKESPSAPPSRPAPTSRPAAPSGGPGRSGSTRTGSCSSTKPG